MPYPRIILAGVNSGAGKTTLTLGLIAALKKRGLRVQPFKAGPDYIDPSYHSALAQRPCRNLDTWMLAKNTVLELFMRQAKISDISVIEGVMGLYDGLKGQEYGSTAHLAKIIKAPVILILDVKSMSRSAGAIVLGYQKFDSRVNIRGVILNNVGSFTHYMSAKEAIEQKTGLPVLGFLPKDRSLALRERHLGLVPTYEKPFEGNFIARLSGLIEKNIDIAKIIQISRKAPDLSLPKNRIFSPKIKHNKVNIAVAKDAAFNFYYQDNLDLLKHYGADLLEFSPLKDKRLPKGADGVYIGGGFPELFAAELAKNCKLRQDILKQAQKGLPVYAECAGLIYLGKKLVDFQGRKFPMAGVFNFTTKMGKGLRALGYVDIVVRSDNPLSAKGTQLKAHMFHWSFLDSPLVKNNFVYSVKKDKQDEFLEGLTKWNVLASYAHLHFGACPKVAENFVSCCLKYKNERVN